MGRAALGAAAVVAVVLGSCMAIDAAALGDRIVNGGRIWKCEALGGTRGVDLDMDVGLREGYYLDRKGFVVHRGANLVTADIVQDGTGGRVVGRGVWNEARDGGPGEFGAMDETARRSSAEHSTLTADGRRLAVRAARECGRRNLPR